MKKIRLMQGFFLPAILIVVTSFIPVSNKARMEPAKYIECALPSAPAARNFVPLNAPAAVMIRKDIYTLTAAEITAIKTGITAMRALPLTDPTSWQYQAAIHGTLLGNNLPQWNSCQHGTQFFLSWHRMYLYYFERILRKKSGNPNLTLPYWNYQSNPVLPPDYRNSAAGNPLYDGSRNSSINSGGSLSSGIMTAINNSLADISFFNFQSDLEGPHGSVHVAIGGNMGAVPKAALDACFWLHHANIDRLWEAWLRKCGGRSNPPASDPWMSQQFTFYDENGAAVNMTGSQVINTASTLNYRYDFPFILPCDFKIHWPVWKWKWWEILRIPKPVRFTENITKISFKDMPTDNLKKFIDETKTTRFNFSGTGAAPDRLFIVLEGLKAEKLPEGSIEVYLNLKPGEAPSPKSVSFAGVLDLFTGTAMHSDHHATGANDIRVNLSTAAANLKLTPADLAKAELSFVVRGNNLKGREVKTSAAFSVASLAMGVEKGQ